jgi:CHAD domain-containing protein
MLEEERKYEVDQGFTVPDLAGCLPGGRVIERKPKHLHATYHDTAELRLARNGASLRFRLGDALPWTVKLPTEIPGVRNEISRAGDPDTIPAELVALVTAYARGAPLLPGAVLHTVRRVYELRDAQDRELAELDDDAVSVLEGQALRLEFREIEVERHEGARTLLDHVDVLLRDAGATAASTAEAFQPKHVRALRALRGTAELGPPEPAPPGPVPPAGASAGDVMLHALRTDIGRIFAHDPLVRLRAGLPRGDTPVHQMRVGCRRLRSNLRTFRPLLERSWVDELRAEVAWLAAALGAARDAEVLRARLQNSARLDPLAPLDEAALTRVDAALAERHEQALAALDAALAGERHLGLLERLVEAAAGPPLPGDEAGLPASEVLPGLVWRPWDRLVRGAGTGGAPGDLDPLAPDERWHEARVRAKRARYALEAVAGVLGGTLAGLARAVAAVQDLLGEHQDAVVAAQAWLEIAGDKPDDHALAVTAGRLVERERAVVRDVRTRFPDAWRAVVSAGAGFARPASVRLGHGRKTP